MDILSSLWGFASFTYHSFMDIFHANAWLALGLLAVLFFLIFIGISWLMSFGEGALKAVAILCFIAFLLVLLAVLWQEYHIGVNLSNALLNVTNGTG